MVYDDVKNLYILFMVVVILLKKLGNLVKVWSFNLINKFKNISFYIFFLKL